MGNSVFRFLQFYIVNGARTAVVAGAGLKHYPRIILFALPAPSGTGSPV